MEKDLFNQIINSDILAEQISRKLKGNPLSELSKLARSLNFQFDSSLDVDSVRQRLSCFLESKEGKMKAFQTLHHKESFIKGLYGINSKTRDTNAGQLSQSDQQSKEETQKQFIKSSFNLMKSQYNLLNLRISNELQPFPRNFIDVNCYCGDLNSIDIMDYQGNSSQYIKCSFCNKLSHQHCFYHSKINFVCPQCQLSCMDPLIQPVYLLVEPFKIHSLDEKQKNLVTKNFVITSNLFEQVQNYQENLQIQLRCLRISENDQIIKNQFPSWGSVKIVTANQLLERNFILEQGHQKRSDRPIDIPLDKFQENFTNQLQAIHIIKTPEDAKQKYVCGLYIVKKIDPDTLINHIKNNEIIPFQNTFENYKQLIEQSSEETDIQLNKVVISLKCNITQKHIITPAIGQWCNHIHKCFDLETYIKMNSKYSSSRWKCPWGIHDNPIFLKVDEFTLKLINKIKECFQIEDIKEVYLDQQMNVILKFNNKTAIEQFTISNDNFVLKCKMNLSNEFTQQVILDDSIQDSTYQNQDQDTSKSKKRTFVEYQLEQLELYLRMNGFILDISQINSQDLSDDFLNHEFKDDIYIQDSNGEFLLLQDNQ